MFEDGVYVPLTLLIDRAINPTKTVDGLIEIKVKKLEIIEEGKIIETIEYNLASQVTNLKRCEKTGTNARKK